MVRVGADQTQTVLTVYGAEDVVDVVTRYGRPWADEAPVTPSNDGPRVETFIIGGGRVSVPTRPAARTHCLGVDTG